MGEAATVEAQLAAKRPLIARVARAFVRRTSAIEYDDAVQIVAIEAWRVLENPVGVFDVDDTIAMRGFRRLTDELRTGHTGALTRGQLRSGWRIASSLNANITDSDGKDTEWIELLADPHDQYEEINEDREAVLASALAELPEREHLIVYLYHFEQLPMREIGTMLGVTESRICQLHTRACARMRRRLAA